MKERREKKNKEIRNLAQKAINVCESYFHEDYRYNSQEAVEELGLDEELVDQLIEDYVIQIIKSVMQFEEILYKLQAKVDAKEAIDLSEFKDLAHKNLGVARNLRIKDAESILKEMMQSDDLEKLFSLIEILRACAIRLNPVRAYNTIKIIEIKSTF